MVVFTLAAGASLGDEDQMRAFRLKLAEECVEVTLAGPNGAPAGMPGDDAPVGVYFTLMVSATPPET